MAQYNAVPTARFEGGENRCSAHAGDARMRAMASVIARLRVGARRFLVAAPPSSELRSRRWSCRRGLRGMARRSPRPRGAVIAAPPVLAMARSEAKAEYLLACAQPRGDPAPRRQRPS